MGNAPETCRRQTAVPTTTKFASFIVPATVRTIASTTIFLEFVFNAIAAIITSTPVLLEKLIDFSAAAPSLTTWRSPMELPAAALLQNICEVTLVTAATTSAAAVMLAALPLMMLTAAAAITIPRPDASPMAMVHQDVTNYWVRSYIYKYILETLLLFPKVTMDTLYPSDILNINIAFY